jgi:type IV pilus assembly protein PilO
MDKLKQWIGLTVVAVLVVGAGGWFLLISPKRSDAASLRDTATAQETTNEGLKSDIKVLKEKAKGVPEQQAKIAAVQVKLPEVPAEPALIRSLTAAADKAGIKLDTIKPATPTSYDPALPGNTQTPGFAPLQIDLSIAGTYFETQTFIAQLEGMSRSLRVVSVHIAPGLSSTETAGASASAATDGSSLLTTISVLAYTASIPTDGALPGAASAGSTAAAASTATSTAGSGSSPTAK